ncbi:MAG: hypothetical protein JW820_18715 [Spirochaetales bacterium]|nr:hypothetical protein [Spirochaetales bacterium]
MARYYRKTSSSIGLDLLYVQEADTYQMVWPDGTARSFPGTIPQDVAGTLEEISLEQFRGELLRRQWEKPTRTRPRKLVRLTPGRRLLRVLGIVLVLIAIFHFVVAAISWDAGGWFPILIGLFSAGLGICLYSGVTRHSAKQIAKRSAAFVLGLAVLVFLTACGLVSVDYLGGGSGLSADSAAGADKRNGSTTTTQALALSQEAWTLDELPAINDSRNALMELAEEKLAPWSGLEPPGEEHLVVEELEALLDQAGSLEGGALLLSAMSSSPLPELIETWIDVLEELVGAERALAEDFSVENATANDLAWEKEGRAYERLVDYYNSHRLRFIHPRE